MRIHSEVRPPANERLATFCGSANKSCFPHNYGNRNVQLRGSEAFSSQL
jgi:hypothetical protein